MRCCTAHNRRGFKGFTLVEILIVVIILGILASIIIGLIGNTSKDAGVSSLKDNLRSMRSALQIYLAQHAGYPAATTFEDQMTMYTDASGATSTTKTPAYPYGPYILAMPPLPVGTEKGKATITNSSTYSAGFGWRYDATTGQFKANLPDTDVDEAGIAFNTY
jgi:prepilin-type N-terminal cleavage/methylation domain-containing protein